MLGITSHLQILSVTHKRTCSWCHRNTHIWFLVQNTSTKIYNDSLKHLENYEPVKKYIGTPYKVRWIEETKYDESTLTMVVPVKGPKGTARLIIIGRKGDSNE